MATTERIRWIGFDMDECIGSVMPLYWLLSNMPGMVLKDNKYSVSLVRYHILKTLFQSESSRRTWLMRSSMFPVLHGVFKAYEQNQIQGAFVFSNNGSQELVDFIGLFLNACMWQLFDMNNAKPMIFQMACCSQSPEREGYGYVKNFEVIQKSLLQNGLPPCSSKNDLLFFDDSVHELTKEIPNYVQVPAYFHLTDITSFSNALSPLSLYFNSYDWSYIVSQSKHMFERDMARPDNRYIAKPQPIEESLRDTKVFMNGLNAFLNS